MACKELHVCTCLSFFVFLYHSSTKQSGLDAVALRIHDHLQPLGQFAAKTLHVMVCVYVLADTTEPATKCFQRFCPRLARLCHSFALAYPSNGSLMQHHFLQGTFACCQNGKCGLASCTCLIQTGATGSPHSFYGRFGMGRAKKVCRPSFDEVSLSLRRGSPSVWRGRPGKILEDEVSVNSRFLLSSGRRARQ